MIFPDIASIKNYLISLLPNLIGSLLILILFYTIANIVYNYFNNSTKVKVNQESKSSDKINLAYYQLKIILYYIILSIGIVYAFTNLGYSSTILLTIFGVSTLAIGLSLKHLLDSFIAGIYLSIIELYVIGDYIKVSYIPTKNFDEGYVVDFNLIYTTLKSNDGILIKIPNDKIQSNIVINNIISNTNNISNNTDNNINNIINNINNNTDNNNNNTDNNTDNNTYNNTYNNTDNNTYNNTDKNINNTNNTYI